MSTQALPRMVTADERFVTLQAKLRECTASFPDWPAEQCAQEYQKVCAAAGRMVFHMIQRGELSLPDLPPWLCEPPAQSDPEPQTRAQFALWWLAVISWMEQRNFVQVTAAAGVSYHREVFQMWRPNQMFYKYPYLSFHPGLCKQYGPASCQQSVRALQFLACDTRCRPDTQEAHEVASGSESQPTQTVAAPATAPQQAKIVRYVASQNSDVYHTPSCPAAKRIKPDHLVTYSRRPAGKRLHSACAKSD